MTNCPYCGTENLPDAKECHNCSADLSNISQGNLPPESTAPTMISSGAEVAAMLTDAKAEKESEEPAAGEPVPTPDYAAPTMVSSSAEVAAMLSDTQAEKEAESEPEVPSELETSYAPTLMSIPDPLGSMESEEPPASREESQPEPKFQETPTPLFNERVDVSTPPTTSAPSPSTPETLPKKDNRLLYALAGCGCLSIACACVFALYYAFQYFPIR